MEAAAQFLLGTVRSAFRLPETTSTDASRESSETSASDHSDGDELVSNLSVQDVLEVKYILQEATKMPLELIDEIIDFAEYWPCSTIKSLSRKLATGISGYHDHCESKRSNVLVLRSWPLGYSPACGYLSTNSHRKSYQDKVAKPLFPASDLSFLEPDTASVLEQWATHTMPRGKNPCRKIVFTINSMDQGWGGRPQDYGTYQGSYTWFDVGLERFTALKCSESEDRVQTEDQKAINYASQGRDDGCWLTRPEGRAEWIVSSAQLTEEIQFLTPSKSLPNFLKYNLLTIIPKTLTDLEYLRPDHPFLPPETRLQTNVMGGTKYKEHVITWSFDDDVKPDSAEGDELGEQGRGKESMTGEFVRSLKLGDIITVWARARFPGWTNKVEQVKMDIYWAV